MSEGNELGLHGFVGWNTFLVACGHNGIVWPTFQRRNPTPQAAENAASTSSIVHEVTRAGVLALFLLMSEMPDPVRANTKRPATWELSSR